MTNMSDDTPNPGSPSSDWGAKTTAYHRLRDELMPRNKATLFDLLAAASITHIIVSFDGCGDSGQIESMEAKAGDATAAIPQVQIEITRAVWGQTEPERSLVNVADVIESVVYDCLEDTHSGWEDNDGAYGEFTFDVAAPTITLDYNERYIEIANDQHVF
jgi:hypothetical protein